MKVAKEAELNLDDDPRPKDRVMWNRLRLILESELCNQAWGCSLYRLHREGRINNDQREAGDRYWKIYDDFRRAQETDPDERPDRELSVARVKRAKRNYADARDIMGLSRNWVHALVWDDVWPASERAHLTVKAGLALLANFFATGKNKR